MSLYALADTHLSIRDNKPMDIFGARWTGYTEKLKTRWSRVVTDGDTVVVAGDISWAMSHTGAVDDLRFLNELPGKKIIGRGNHDYWWTSLTKLNALTKAEGLDTIRFLYNNAWEVEDFIVCGSRGWYIDEFSRRIPQDSDYQKIVSREAIRLELSIAEAVKLQNGILAQTGVKKEILAFLHFPPDFNGYVCAEIVAVLKRYGIRRCFFGHIHGVYDAPRCRTVDGISYVMTSADYLDFTPLPILPDIQF